MSAICEKCSTEEQEVAFDSVSQLFSHKKGGHKTFEGVIKKQPKPAQERPNKPEKEPEAPPPLKPVAIALKYKYEGQCDSGHELDTILIPVGDMEMAVAYCPTDKEQISEQLVMPIKKQIMKTPDKKVKN